MHGNPIRDCCWEPNTRFCAASSASSRAASTGGPGNGPPIAADLRRIGPRPADGNGAGELQAVAVDGLEAVVLDRAGQFPLGRSWKPPACGRTNVRLLRNPPDVFAWMAWCDLAVIAAGKHAMGTRLLPGPCIASCKRRPIAGNGHAAKARCVPVAGPRQAASAGQLAKAISTLCHDPQCRAPSLRTWRRWSTAAGPSASCRQCGRLRAQA